MNMDIKFVSRDSLRTTPSAYFGNSTLYWYAGQYHAIMREQVALHVTRPHLPKQLPFAKQ